jgi:hypothetical protein
MDFQFLLIRLQGSKSLLLDLEERRDQDAVYEVPVLHMRPVSILTANEDVVNDGHTSQSLLDLIQHEIQQLIIPLQNPDNYVRPKVNFSQLGPKPSFWYHTFSSTSELNSNLLINVFTQIQYRLPFWFV